MAAERILVVEDDDPIAELIRYNLVRAGFRVTRYASGEKLLLDAALEPPDLVLLDLMLPGADGLEICRVLRDHEATRGVPIIMVTARGEEAEIVRGLECGADDYVVKPFSPRVLLARVEAVLRRRAREGEQRAAAGEVLRHGGLVLDSRRHRAEVSGQEAHLTLTEFRILQHLVRQPGRVFSRAQLVEAVRGGGYHVTERSMDVAIFGLRKKLESWGRLVETVRGVGYRLCEAPLVDPDGAPLPDPSGRKTPREGEKRP